MNGRTLAVVAVLAAGAAGAVFWLMSASGPPSPPPAASRAPTDSRPVLKATGLQRPLHESALLRAPDQALVLPDAGS